MLYVEPTSETLVWDEKKINSFHTPPTITTLQDAVDKLNGLQTNFAVLEAVRKTGGSANKDAIPEMLEFVRRSGYKVQQEHSRTVATRRQTNLLVFI